MKGDPQIKGQEAVEGPHYCVRSPKGYGIHGPSTLCLRNQERTWPPHLKESSGPPAPQAPLFTGTSCLSPGHLAVSSAREPSPHYQKG